MSDRCSGDEEEEEGEEDDAGGEAEAEQFVIARCRLTFTGDIVPLTRTTSLQQRAHAEEHPAAAIDFACVCMRGKKKNPSLYCCILFFDRFENLTRAQVPKRREGG